MKNLQIAWNNYSWYGKVVLIYYFIVVFPALILHELSHLLVLLITFNTDFKCDFKFYEINDKEYVTGLIVTYTTTSNIIGIITSTAPLITLIILIYFKPVFMITWSLIGGYRGFLLSETDIKNFIESLNNIKIQWNNQIN